MIVVTTPWCPRNECVQYPPSTSQTRIFLSAPAVASNPPEASQAMSATGPLCAYKINNSSFNPVFKKISREHRTASQNEAIFCTSLESNIALGAYGG